MKRRRESTDHVMGTVNLLVEFSRESKIGDRPSGRMSDVTVEYDCATTYHTVNTYVL